MVQRVISDPNIVQIVQNPGWLAHRYDPGHDTVHFIYAAREERARATFLRDEYLNLEGVPAILAHPDAVAAAPAAAPLHFVFHSAFCCSTLLARALDRPGIATTLKEPTILNDIVGWRHLGSVDGARVAQTLDQTLNLLARPFKCGEAVIVKPSNVVSGLADAIMAMRPTSCALLLHAPLPVYLRSIAKKGIDGRLWVRDLLAKLLGEGIVDLGFTGEDYFRLTDLQAAAVGWLAQHALFERLSTRYGARVRTLDSETLLTRPGESISALALLFGLALDEVDVVAILSGPAFTTHSKGGAGFGVAARDAEYRVAADAHSDEIRKVEAWAKAIADTARVPMTLPSGLLDNITAAVSHV